jgi:hypothetical protein
MNLTFRWLVPELHIEPPATGYEASRLFVVYGLGYMAVFLILASLYLRAAVSRECPLDERDRFEARAHAGAHAASAAVGLISIGWAAIAPEGYITLAGPVYFLMGPTHALYGMWTGVRRRRAFESGG